MVRVFLQVCIHSTDILWNIDQSSGGACTQCTSQYTWEPPDKWLKSPVCPESPPQTHRIPPSQAPQLDKSRPVQLDSSPPLPPIPCPYSFPCPFPCPYSMPACPYSYFPAPGFIAHINPADLPHMCKIMDLSKLWGFVSQIVVDWFLFCTSRWWISVVRELDQILKRKPCPTP